MELILIRHGLPERRQDTADPPLTEVGHDQARRAARRLAREKIDAVFASPMLRAVQTAQPFVDLSGHPLATRAGIVEFNRDAGGYVPMEELKREDYAAWRALAEGGHDIDIQGFSTLVAQTLEAIIADHPSKTVAVFCHGGVINVWTAHVLGMAPRLFFEPGYASIHRYLCASSGQRNLIALNERAHLED